VLRRSRPRTRTCSWGRAPRARACNIADRRRARHKLPQARLGAAQRARDRGVRRMRKPRAARAARGLRGRQRRPRRPQLLHAPAAKRQQPRAAQELRRAMACRAASALLQAGALEQPAGVTPWADALRQPGAVRRHRTPTCGGSPGCNMSSLALCMAFNLMRECRGGSGGRGGCAQARRSSAASARAPAAAPFSVGACAAHAPTGPEGLSSAAARPSPKPCPGRSGGSAIGPCSSSCCRRDLQSAHTALKAAHQSSEKPICRTSNLF